MIRPAALVLAMLTPFAQAQESPPRLIAPFSKSEAQATRAKWAEVLNMPGLYTDEVGIRFALIPPGEFQMGSDSHDVGERPRHRVVITNPFYAGIYEVTVGQFRKFVEATEYKTEAERDGQGGFGYNPDTNDFEGRSPKFTWRYVGWRQSDRHPVVNVSWNDAQAFTAWLTKTEGKNYRLLSEAEWEYCCRAGSGSDFFYGDNPDSLVTVGNVADITLRNQFPKWTTVTSTDGELFTCSTGRFEPNNFGLYDMHGNVWEWCLDAQDASYYSKSPSEDPINLAYEGQRNRVLRGGCWNSTADFCRSSFRFSSPVDFRYYFVGFRVAIVKKDPSAN